MKNLFLIAIIVLGFTVNSFAQLPAKATASATIIAPITIAKTVEMNFGNVAVGTTLGTVVLDPAGSRTKTGGVTLPAVAGIVTAASFNVTGVGTSTYSITIPTTDLTVTSGSNTMIVNAFTSTPTVATGGVLTAGGTQTITVGATLNVAGAQVAGVYVSGTPFDVSVNYN